MLIPVFEWLKAWFPTSAEEDTLEYVDITNFLVDKPYSTVYLKVSWESMLGEWIKDWDYIIVDKSLQPVEDDIVVAIVDKEYTLKYLARDDSGSFYLKTANPEFKDIYPEEELMIFGVVTWVFRKYR